ncbi:Uncharacterised protein [Mycobacteroides abscessus subsp. massiliense]|nr:Uncharacterised protein [Mycobacteroides abscessus subsp. massiliense]
MQQGRPQGEGGRNGQEHRDGDRGAHGVEVVEPRETQTQPGPRDRQARADDDVGYAPVRGIEGVLPVQARIARLVVPTQQEDSVIGPRPERQRDHDVDGE